MIDKGSVRIDKFLWAVRIFKTRSLASNACRMGRILIGNIPVKPSRLIDSDQVLTIKKPPVTYKFKVLEPVEKRVSAKLTPRYIEDLTSEDEKRKIEVRTSGAVIHREKGTGRPTKKDRRLIDRLQDAPDD